MANGQKRQCHKKINEEQKTTILCTKSTIKPQKQIKQQKKSSKSKKKTQKYDPTRSLGGPKSSKSKKNTKTQRTRRFQEQDVQKNATMTKKEHFKTDNCKRVKETNKR